MDEPSVRADRAGRAPLRQGCRRRQGRHHGAHRRPSGVRGRPPVGVTLFVEGEEEDGSPTLTRFLESYGDRLVADAIVVADSVNWTVDTVADHEPARPRGLLCRDQGPRRRSLGHVRWPGHRRVDLPVSPAGDAARRAGRCRGARTGPSRSEGGRLPGGALPRRGGCARRRPTVRQWLARRPLVDRSRCPWSPSTPPVSPMPPTCWFPPPGRS